MYVPTGFGATEPSAQTSGHVLPYKGSCPAGYVKWSAGGRSPVYCRPQATATAEAVKGDMLRARAAAQANAQADLVERRLRMAQQQAAAKQQVAAQKQQAAQLRPKPTLPAGPSAIVPPPTGPTPVAPLQVTRPPCGPDKTLCEDWGDLVAQSLEAQGKQWDSFFGVTKDQFLALHKDVTAGKHPNLLQQACAVCDDQKNVTLQEQLWASTRTALSPTQQLQQLVETSAPPPEAMEQPPMTTEPIVTTTTTTPQDEGQKQGGGALLPLLGAAVAAFFAFK